MTLSNACLAAGHPVYFHSKYSPSKSCAPINKVSGTPSRKQLVLIDQHSFLGRPLQRQ